LGRTTHFTLAIGTARPKFSTELSTSAVDRAQTYQKSEDAPRLARRNFNESPATAHHRPWRFAAVVVAPSIRYRTYKEPKN
jgi:hypothetical protein